MRRHAAWLACLALMACAQTPSAPALVDLLSQPAERSLLTGLRAYDDALYIESERQLIQALNRLPVNSGNDTALL